MTIDTHKKLFFNTRRRYTKELYSSRYGENIVNHDVFVYAFGMYIEIVSDSEYIVTIGNSDCSFKTIEEAESYFWDEYVKDELFSVKKESKDPLTKLFTEEIPVIYEELSKNSKEEKYARKCDCCGKGMNRGFHDAGNYYCEERCLIWGNSQDGNTFTMEKWKKDSKENPDHCYWTEWEEIDQDSWFTENGVEVTECQSCRKDTYVNDEFSYCVHCLEPI